MWSHRGGRHNASYLLPEKAQPKALQSVAQHQQLARRQDIIPGFLTAESFIAVEFYAPPHVPSSFVAMHKFADAPAGGRTGQAEAKHISAFLGSEVKHICAILGELCTAKACTCGGMSSMPGGPCMSGVAQAPPH